MDSRKIYRDIAERTGGDIYIGVVGPVRTGKSTFINRFMETTVIPNIVSEYDRKKAKDELPQSAQGKTVMTAEPKFIPDEAIDVSFDDGASVRLRMIDCVGYIIPGALGITEDGEVRMVKTPWSEETIPFEEAAKQGTDRVMREHSTIGIIVTCDASFGEIPRESYVEAEEQIVYEMKSVGKPFVIVLNSKAPSSREAEELAISLEGKYNCPVALVNCLELNYDDIENILEMMLYEFPVTEIKIQLPGWCAALPNNHRLTENIIKCLKETGKVVHTLNDIKSFKDSLEAMVGESLGEGKDRCKITLCQIDLACGRACIKIDLPDNMYYDIICDLTGVSVSSQNELISALIDLSMAKEELGKYKDAIDQLEHNGYGIVMPKMEELTITEPEVIKNSGSYGVKLCAKAESIHMIKADIETEINPIVGTQEQAEEIIQRLLTEYEDDPQRLWESNIFGKSLYELVNDGLKTKIAHLSPESQQKLSETLSRIVNESSNGLICILL